MNQPQANLEAMERTVAALREAGRLDPADDARVTAALALAEAVDAEPTNASLWREYRAAEAALREFEDDSIGAMEALRESLSASVRNITDARQKHEGSRGGGDGGGVGPSVDAVAAAGRRGRPRAPS